VEVPPQNHLHHRAIEYMLMPLIRMVMNEKLTAEQRPRTITEAKMEISGNEYSSK